MTENSKLAAALRWAPPIFNTIYKVLVLAALIWIGISLQDVANALYSSGETCVVDPSASDGSDESSDSGLVKPLFRGTL